jgi:hypothetical protein
MPAAAGLSDKSQGKSHLPPEVPPMINSQDLISFNLQPNGPIIDETIGFTESTIRAGRVTVTIVSRGGEPLRLSFSQSGRDRSLTRTSSDTVAFVQTRLAQLGFLQGGTKDIDGIPLVPDGVLGPATGQAIKLYKAIQWRAGNDGVLDGMDGSITDLLLTDLSSQKRRLWLQIDKLSFPNLIDWPNGHPFDGYGIARWKPVLSALADSSHPPLRLIIVGNVSQPPGGPFPLHQTHQCGIDADCIAPTVTGELNLVTYHDPTYDRGRMRALLSSIRSLRVASRVWFNDPVLISEGLCSPLEYHDNHAHVRLRLPTPFPAYQRLWFGLLSLAGSQTPAEETRVWASLSAMMPVRSMATDTWAYSLNPSIMSFLGRTVPVFSRLGTATIVLVSFGKLTHVVTLRLERRGGDLELRVLARGSNIVWRFRGKSARPVRHPLYELLPTFNKGQCPPALVSQHLFDTLRK